MRPHEPETDFPSAAWRTSPPLGVETPSSKPPGHAFRLETANLGSNKSAIWGMSFYDALRRACAALAPLVRESAERAAWKRLLLDVT